MRRDLIYTLLAFAVLVLAIVPIGTAVFVLGFVYGDSPCVMCWEQRTGMAIIALIGLFILRYGPRPKYIGLSVLVGRLGNRSWACATSACTPRATWGRASASRSSACTPTRGPSSSTGCAS